jgi:AraC family transcriptional regulator
MYEVTIETLKQMPLAAVSHTGPYTEIGRAFQTLYATLGARNMIPYGGKIIGIYYDDPNVVAVDKLRSMAAVSFDRQDDLAPPLERADIPAGRYGWIMFKGPYNGLGPAYRWFFGEWLVSSGYELDDRPSFEEYLNSPMDTPQNELLTKIFIPLKD